MANTGSVEVVSPNTGQKKVMSRFELLKMGSESYTHGSMPDEEDAITADTDLQPGSTSAAVHADEGERSHVPDDSESCRPSAIPVGLEKNHEDGNIAAKHLSQNKVHPEQALAAGDTDSPATPAAAAGAGQMPAAVPSRTDVSPVSRDIQAHDAHQPLAVHMHEPNPPNGVVERKFEHTPVLLYNCTQAPDNAQPPPSPGSKITPTYIY